MHEDWKIKYKNQINDLIFCSKVAYQRNLVCAAGGNISARCGDNIAITASNSSFRNINQNELVLCNINGETLDAPIGAKASKELGMHLNIYRIRKEANYVVHLHPCYSILWSTLKDPLPLLTESAKLKLKKVPMISDEKPGSEELAKEVNRVVKESDEECTAFILKNHGIIVLGKTMETCLNQAELLEETAKIAVLHRLLIK